MYFYQVMAASVLPAMREKLCCAVSARYRFLFALKDIIYIHERRLIVMVLFATVYLYIPQNVGLYLFFHGDNFGKVDKRIKIILQSFIFLDITSLQHNQAFCFYSLSPVPKIASGTNIPIISFVSTIILHQH